ncbi:hypothetical protein BKA57DRAFT_295734 [Linnemannia elongata]|nr:hypothetical protein BKA57DRAFT_295734 [Linnemannia elongata]
MPPCRPCTISMDCYRTLVSNGYANSDRKVDGFNNSLIIRKGSSVRLPGFPYVSQSSMPPRKKIISFQMTNHPRVYYLNILFSLFLFPSFFLLFFIPFNFSHPQLLLPLFLPFLSPSPSAFSSNLHINQSNHIFSHITYTYIHHGFWIYLRY